MDTRSLLEGNILAAIEAMDALKGQLQAFDDLVEVVCESLRNGGKLLLCGNGGSAADCQHIAAELVGRFVNDRAALPAVSLTSDTSAITSIANDFGFDQVFSRQLEGIGRPNDCLLVLSTSGRSGNVVNAVQVAKGMRIKTLGLTGKDGGLLKQLCDHCVVIPSNSTARIQEAHMLLGHTLCESVEMRAPELVRDSR